MRVDKQTTTFKKVLSGFGIASLGVAGKVIYDYKKEDSNQSFKS